MKLCNKSRITLIAIGVVSALIPIVCSFIIGLVDLDPAVILSEMERIADGFVPYKTIHLNYPPLFFYICVSLKWLFHVPYGCYPFYLALNYVFLFISAYCIFRISREFGGSKCLSLFCSWLFFMVSLRSQGNVVLFEMPSVCFGLVSMSCLLSFRNRNSFHFLWIGILSAFSFLSKQFGAGFCLLGFYIIVAFADSCRWKKTVMYSLGYSIPVLLCILFWGKDFISSVLLNGYGTETAFLAGYDTSLGGKLRQISDNLFYFSSLICPIVFAALLSVPSVIKNRRWRELIFCVCGILGFSLQYWFVAVGLHYTLYMIPFAILFIPLVVESYKSRKYIKLITNFAIVFTLLFAVFSTYRRSFIRIKYPELQKFTEMSKRLSSEIEPGKTVWICDGWLEYLYYFNNLTPPNMASVGYATGPLEVTKEKQWKQVKSADYVIHYVKENTYDYSFDEEVRAFVDQFPSVPLNASGTVVVHKMK